MKKVIIDIKVVESFIGEDMVVLDNSYCTMNGVRGRLYGKIVRIVSEPFKDTVENHTHEFVLVKSYDSGLIYQVLFNESWIVKVERVKIFHDTTIGRIIKLNDGSYNKNLTSGKHDSGVYGREFCVITEPFVEEDEDFHHKYLAVNAFDIENGHIYRILFNEDAIITENEQNVWWAEKSRMMIF